MGNWIFGCDECQSICPWPRRFARATGERFVQHDPEWCAPRLLDLIAMDEGAFRARFAGGPVLRARRRGLLRNVAIALANWGDSRAMPALQRATEDPEPLVCEHAAWAIAHIRLK
jgi:epoxyqueuosine reductase